ncbi:MAG TPA: TetR family transcriptional regulator [Verrucomicrobiae bacterium]|nr:TetR family transcriptional regulator [Verrucomicrobiae bacterium]
MSSPLKPRRAVARNPERTRERILAAALKEFAARGFAGARVDAIARAAEINKRMLYHYFGNKESLFREILRRKMGERRAWAESLSGDPAESLPFWFEQACKDMDWIRLLEWEALQTSGKRVIDEEQRSEAARLAVERMRRRQEKGLISKEYDPRHLILAMYGLTTYPVAFPQMARLITGLRIEDPQFQKDRMAFLRKFAEALRPAPNSKTV